MKYQQRGLERVVKNRSYVVWAVAVALAAAGFAAHADEACCPAGEPCDRALQVVGTNSVALGTLYTSDITNVPFRVVNKGTNAVAIKRLIPTCTCTTGTASTNVVAPGASVVITVNLDPHTLKGDFDRGVWVISDDSTKPYLKVMLTGTAEPLFKGLPDGSVLVSVKEAGASVTNRFTLVATVADVVLGAPAIETNGAVRVALTVVTNAAPTASYELTTVITPLELGTQGASLTLPVGGRVGSAPLAIPFKITTGTTLLAIPDRLLFKLDNQPQIFRTILRGKGAKLDSAAFTSDPALEGVQVSAIKGRRVDELMIKIEVSPAGAETLYLNTNSVLRLRHPGFAPATVTFSDDRDEPKKTGSRRDRVPDIFRGFPARGDGRFSF